MCGYCVTVAGAFLSLCADAISFPSCVSRTNECIRLIQQASLFPGRSPEVEVSTAIPAPNRFFRETTFREHDRHVQAVRKFSTLVDSQIATCSFLIPSMHTHSQTQGAFIPGSTVTSVRDQRVGEHTIRSDAVRVASPVMSSERSETIG